MRQIWFGIVLTLVGTWLEVSNLGVMGYLSFSRSWPVLLILAGVIVIIRSLRFAARHRRMRRLDVIRELEQGRISVEEAVTRLECTSS
ncbi:MAG: DUF5668 domain-containing protein [candidate division WOR-3 bacterium]